MHCHYEWGPLLSRPICYRNHFLAHTGALDATVQFDPSNLLIFHSALWPSVKAMMIFLNSQTFSKDSSSIFHSYISLRHYMFRLLPCTRVISNPTLSLDHYIVSMKPKAISKTRANMWPHCKNTIGTSCLDMLKILFHTNHHVVRIFWSRARFDIHQKLRIILILWGYSDAFVQHHSWLDVHLLLKMIVAHIMHFFGLIPW